MVRLKVLQQELGSNWQELGSNIGRTSLKGSQGSRITCQPIHTHKQPVNNNYALCILENAVFYNVALL